MKSFDESNITQYVEDADLREILPVDNEPNLNRPSYSVEPDVVLQLRNMR